MNQGECVIKFANTAECSCPANFTGFLCEKPNPCASNPCINGGTCVASPGIITTFQCACASGFEGQTCEKDTEKICTANRCLNGGTCSVNSTTNTTQCACTPFYIGKYTYSY